MAQGILVLHMEALRGCLNMKVSYEQTVEASKPFHP